MTKYRTRDLTCLLVWFVAFFVSGAWADSPATTIELPPKTLPYPVGQHFEYLVSADRELSLEVIRTSSEFSWTATDTENPNFGFSPDTYWFRSHIVNTSTDHVRWLLSLGYPLLDDIEVYAFQEDRQLAHYRTGDRYPFNERPIANRNFLFPLLIEPDSRIALYIRIRTTSAVQAPLAITTQEALLQTEQTFLMVQGMYFGIIAIMFFYNLFVFFSTKDRTYLLYVLLVLGIGGFQYSMHGFSYQFIWRDSPWMQDRMTGMFVALTSFAGAWFTIRFLNLRVYSSYLYYILACLSGAAGAVTVFALILPYEHVIKTAAMLGFGFIIVASVSGFYVWHRGYKPARLYSLAFASLLLGSALLILNKFGLIPLNFMTENGQQIGSLVKLVLLSFALAYRIKVLREETEQARLEVTLGLEQRVRERTLELEEANEKLQKLSSSDPLTGVYNRRYFTEQLAIEWKRAKRDGHPLSIIMIDIDHFKSFNDRFGHLVGDDCLRFLARHLSDAVCRPADMIVRYGGEEFAVVLPNTEENGARSVAIRIKQNLDQNLFQVDEEQIRLTVSQGIATTVPQLGDEAYEMLISYADQALYETKAKGRDCCCIYNMSETALPPY
ncbi:diguanylate cyclase [Allohahella marinimesophila]|uniref:diguanylate cyclase n=2 Tax=Allohahella marinimesophila TaxID=1054972 RepID=A0ABP7NG62_9GAMM